MASEMIWDCYVSLKVEYWCCFTAQKGNVNIPFKFWILCFVLPFKCLRFGHISFNQFCETWADGRKFYIITCKRPMHACPISFSITSWIQQMVTISHHFVIILDVYGLGNHFLKNKLLPLRLSWKLLIINYYYYIWIDII